MVTCRCKERDGPDIDWEAFSHWSLPLTEGEINGLWLDARSYSRRREERAITTLVAAHQRLLRKIASLHVDHELPDDQADVCLDRLVQACSQAAEGAIRVCRWRSRRDRADFIRFSFPFIQRALANVLREEAGCALHAFRQSRD